jgi:hypothetical protein
MFEGWRTNAGARVVKKYVDRIEGRRGLIKHGGDLVDVSHIACDRQHLDAELLGQFLRRCFESLDLTRSEDEIRPGVGEP